MRVEPRNHTETHYWITTFWCAFGAIIIAGIVVISYWIRRCRKVKNIMKKMHKQNGLKRSNSAIEFDVSALTAANRRHIYGSNRAASSEQDNSDNLSEHSEKSPLVSARLDNLARIFFSKSMPAETGSRDTLDSVLTTRPNIKYQYSALDRGTDIVERSPRERANREKALNAIQEWVCNTDGRYELIAHLDEIGSRHAKHWFLVTDSSVRTDRLSTLIPLPPDCVALEDVPAGESPKCVLMELLGSLHHPYIYPVLDLGFQRTSSMNYACLVTPFNSRGSLKDLLYKAQWNEPWARKYTRKPTNGLPVTQVQRLGRQILEALLFLKERGFPLHGHLHSGNVILQNGAARLSGLENGLLGLSSRINAVVWSRSTTEIENIDIICFGHLLYEMCTGQEMSTPKPSMRILEMELEHYPQMRMVLDVLGLIFEPPSGVCVSVEELVLCDLFRSIDLRELRGPCFNTIKPSLSRSTLNLLHAVKKRQCASLGNSFSEASSPCTPPSTPRDRPSGRCRTMESFDMISSDSEEGLLDEIVVGSNNYQQQQHHHYHHEHRRQQLVQHNAMQCYQLQQLPPYTQNYQSYHNNIQHQNKELQLQLQQATEATAYHYKAQGGYYCNTMESPIHYCDTALHSDDNDSQENLPPNYQRLPASIQQEKLKELEHSRNLSAPGNASVYARHHYHHDENYDDDDDNNDDNDNYDRSAAAVAVTATNIASTLDNEAGTSVTSIISESTETIKAVNTINLHNDDYDDDGVDVVVDKSTSKCVLLGQSLEMHTFNNVAPHTSNHTNMTCGNTIAAGHHNQLTTDMCNYKNSKSRRLEYSLKCLKYGRSNPSQDSAFGSLTDNDFSTGSSSFRLNSFQSISSPIDEGVEDIIIATTTAGKETCLELATIPRSMVSQDSAISSPCRENSPNNFLHIDDATMIKSASCSGNSSSSSSTGNIRPQQFPVSLSPKILVTATTNSSNSSLSSINVPVPTQTQIQQQQQLQQQQQQFDPPKILVNDQNSIYTTSPSKRTSTIEVFSQKYRVSSFEDMSPGRRSAEKHLRNVNRLAFRSLEEERRIDSAFMPIAERTHSDNRVNMQSEKYKKLTHASFRISKTASQVSVYDSSPRHSLAGSRELVDAMVSDSSNNRQTMWRISKLYRKNRIAKSNDSLLETSPNHSRRLSPSSLRDNHYESCSSSGSRQSLNRGSSTNEINGNGCTPLNLVTTSFCGPQERRYCSSKSEDLADSNDYLRVMDARKSYSERHLVTLTKLRQTAINNSTPGGSNEQFYLSEDDKSFKDDNNAYGYQYQYASQQQQPQNQFLQQRTRHYKNQQQQQQQQQQQHELQHLQPPHQYIKPHPNQLSWSSCSINRLKTTNIKTTSLATLSCLQNLSNTAASLPVSAVPSTSGASYSASTNSSSPSTSEPATEPTKTYTDIGFLSLDCSKLNTPSSNGHNNQGDRINSSNDGSPIRRTLSGAEFSRIFAMVGQVNHSNEEKTPLLDNVEMSPISAGDGDSEHGEIL